MHAAPLTPTSAIAPMVDLSLLNRARPFLLAPPRRRPSERIFAEAIVRCMNEGRRPAGTEVQAVAARIWSDVQTGSRKVPWDEIVPGCGRHRRMVAAARAALGMAKSGGEPP